jgi:hypothetical protein
MRMRVGRWKKWVVVGFVVGVSSLVSTAHAQKSPFQASDGASSPAYAAPADLTGNDVIAKMVEKTRLQTGQLQRYSSVRTYEIRNPEGKLAAQTVARVDFEAPDKKTFNKTSEKGSVIVRHLVFDRLMQSESETSSGREHHDSAITSANYSFELIGEEEVGPYHCFIVEATPKRKDTYLFEGKIWIDLADFAVVKIAGHPAKRLSFWINRADFVRQYQKIDGFWLPHLDETSIEVKIYGRRTLTISHDQYVMNPAHAVPSESGGMADLK